MNLSSRIREMARLWSDPALSLFKTRFLWVLGYFGCILTTGTLAYVGIEQWPWFDAFYMAALTISSVGYGEVHDLSTWGRFFTTALMAMGVVGLGAWWALTTALLVELDLGGLLRRYRNMRIIEDLSDHYIICGAGRLGSVMIQEMQRAKVKFVTVETDPKLAAALIEANPDILLIEADATKDQPLIDAGVRRARGLAACLSNDADNLLLCLTARGLKPGIEIVARAFDEESLSKLRHAGATHAISPNVTGAIRMASSLLRPSVVGFLDAATFGNDISLRLEDALIPEESPLAGITLANAKIRQKTGLIVLALKPGDERGESIYNPGPEQILRAGDTMIVLGRQEQVQKLKDYVTPA